MFINNKNILTGYFIMKHFIRALVGIPIKTTGTTNFRGLPASFIYTTCVANESSERKIDVKFSGDLQTNSSKNVKQETIIPTVVDQFNAWAEDWWDPNSHFKTLHSMNKLRVQLIRNGLLQANQISDEQKNGPHMLKGLKILDVGCGGGILSEPLARLGGEVVGIDAAEKNIEIAQSHAEKNSLLINGLRYIHGSIEEHSKDSPEFYDAVVASDVVEHVNNVPVFMEKCISCLKPGGSMFVTTINKTTRSYWAAIVLAERVLSLLPNGTHEWDRFVSLEELKQLLIQEGCSVRLVHGMFYVPVFNEWYWIPDPSVNYAVHAIKL